MTSTKETEVSEAREQAGRQRICRARAGVCMAPESWNNKIQ